MDENLLLRVLNEAETEARSHSDEICQGIDKAESFYNQEPIGGEKKGRSKVVTSDVLDLVESDMPSLMRMFTSGEDVARFSPRGTDKSSIEEADQKTKYAHFIYFNDNNGFSITQNVLKNGLLKKIGCAKYWWAKERKVTTRSFKFDSVEQAQLQLDKFNEEKGNNAEIVEEVDGKTKIKITKTFSRCKIATVHPKNFLISKGAESKEDAEFVGDREIVTKSDLVERGYDKGKVKDLPRYRSDLNWIENKECTDLSSWPSHKVELVDLYIKIDFDGDGVAERRRVLRVGPNLDGILENEEFSLSAPYALFSPIIMPGESVGKSRAELVINDQFNSSIFLRQVFNNLYSVNSPRIAAQTSPDRPQSGVNTKDLMNHIPDGIVRCGGVPSAQLMPLTTPYVGDKALQVMQFIERKKANKTGSQVETQSIDGDALHKETAARFNGTQKSGFAKIELVGRNVSELFFRSMFEGIIELVSEFQDEEREIAILGKPFVASPNRWLGIEQAYATIGLGASEEESGPQDYAVLFDKALQMRQMFPALVDENKMHSLYYDLVKSLGKKSPERYINDPNGEEAKAIRQEIEDQPPKKDILVEVTEIEQKFKAEIEKLKEQSRAEIEQVKQQGAFDKARFIEQEKTKRELTKLEAETGKNIPGSVI